LVFRVIPFKNLQKKSQKGCVYSQFSLITQSYGFCSRSFVLWQSGQKTVNKYLAYKSQGCCLEFLMSDKNQMNLHFIDPIYHSGFVWLFLREGRKGNKIKLSLD
jgi:hypothetical protein